MSIVLKINIIKQHKQNWYFKKKKRPHFVEMAESRNQNVMGWGENEKWGSWDGACRICFGPFGVPKKLEYGVEGEEKGKLMRGMWIHELWRIFFSSRMKLDHVHILIEKNIHRWVMEDA